MARITIEDCMEKVPNRFHLVRMASIRAKQLKKGARPLLATVENKEIVTALREIAAGVVKPGDVEVQLDASVEAAALEGAAVAESAAVSEGAPPAEGAVAAAADAPVAEEAPATLDGEKPAES